MDNDPTFSLYFWVNHVVTPQWIKRIKQPQCYQCQSSLSKKSPHCHLCGLLYCRPCTTSIHLPQRFNLKKRPFGPYSVCQGCIEQVSTHRLSILSELAQQESSTLNNFGDLPVVQHTIDTDAIERGEEIQMGVIPTLNGSIVSESFSSQYTLLHCFVGVDINITVKQLYNSIYSSQTQQHLESVSFLKDGEIIPVEQLSKITIKQLLPAVFIATPEQIKQYNEAGHEYNAPCPGNVTMLLKQRDEKRRAEKKLKRQSFVTKDIALTTIGENNIQAQPTTESIQEGDEQDDDNNNRTTTTSQNESTISNPTSPDRSHRSLSRARRDTSRTSSKASKTRDTSQSRPRKSDKADKNESTDDTTAWYMALHTHVNTKPQTGDAKSKILSFAKGDRLKITNQSNPDWWFAVTEDGTQKGWIPASYVGPEAEVLKKQKERQKARAERKSLAAGQQ